MFLLQERKPVYLADPMIVMVVPIVHRIPAVTLNQRVDEVFLVVLFNPEHLLQEAREEVRVEELIVFHIVCHIVD